MNLMMWLSGAMALGFGVWLVYALLNAEDI